MLVFLLLFVAAGIAIIVFYKKNNSQQLSIQNYEQEISRLKEEIVSTKNKMAADYQKALDSKTAELHAEMDSKISALEEKHAKELHDVQCRIEARKEVLYQKNEKDLLVDVVLGLGALSKSQESISNKFFSSQEELKSINNNLFNIGDSVLHDISNGHAETIAKLGVHGDMTIASILADILDIMSKK